MPDAIHSSRLAGASLDIAQSGACCTAASSLPCTEGTLSRAMRRRIVDVGKICIAATKRSESGMQPANRIILEAGTIKPPRRERYVRRIQVEHLVRQPCNPISYTLFSIKLTIKES